jgi:inorganic triphosphatase YgiF
MSRSTTEVELKLHIPEGKLNRLRRHPAISRWLAGQPNRTRLVSTYFDTPDLSLYHQKIALRHRKVGGKRFLSIKRAPDGETSVHGRREWETEVSRRKPDFRVIQNHIAGGKKAPGDIVPRLRPLFVTDVERDVWPLKFKNNFLKLAIDVGRITCKGRSVPIREAELELRSGSVGSVYALAQELRKSTPLGLQPLSKAERGYVLAANVSPEPHKAEKLELPRRATVGEAFALIGRGGLLHLRANEASICLNREAEGIHQIRVAVRRLRSALSLFRDLVAEKNRHEIANRLKWIARQFSAAREWDVFHDEMLAAVHHAFPKNPALAKFMAVAERMRREADEQAARIISGPRYAENVLRVGAWWDGGEWKKAATDAAADPAFGFAKARIRALHRRLCKRGDRIGKLNPAGLHELRIRAKKLRYAIGFLGGAFPAKDVRAHVRALSDLQDCLGALNDGDVARRLVGRIEATREIDPIEFTRAAGIVAGWNSARQEAELARLPRAWRRFKELRPFWK